MSKMLRQKILNETIEQAKACLAAKHATDVEQFAAQMKIEECKLWLKELDQ
jgi:hypothetical protein